MLEAEKQNTKTPIAIHLHYTSYTIQNPDVKTLTVSTHPVFFSRLAPTELHVQFLANEVIPPNP